MSTLLLQVLKDVKFPVMLDMYDMCSKELKEKLKPRRTQFKEYEDYLVDKASLSAKGKVKTAALKAEAEAQGGEGADMEDYSFPDDEGSSNSGYYILQVTFYQPDVLLICFLTMFFMTT